jgi:microcystin-dependent protein
MAYPPTPPSNTRTNTTPQVNAHPLDHNTLANNITDIVNELGSNPKGGATDVGARFDLLVPTGCMMDYAGAAAPSGWILCDGTSRSKTNPLYSAFGGAGDSFKPPDLRDKSTVGISGSKVRGSTGGNADLKAHIHTMPQHNHTQNSHTHTMNTHIHTMGTHNHAQNPHSHTMPTHFHTMDEHAHVTDINHDHASFNTSSNGSHFHNGLSGDSFGTLGLTAGIDSGTGVVGLAVGAGFTGITIANTDSNHVHPINVPALGINNKTSTLVDPGDTNAKDPGDTNQGTATNTSTDPGDTNATDPGDTNAKTATNNAVDPGDTNSTGAGTNNYHPYVAVYKIIKL